RERRRDQRGRTGPRALHGLHVCVRGDLDSHHCRDGGRRHPGAEADRMNASHVPLESYLILSGVLFTIGAAGVFLRRNLITLVLSGEIMLNAANLTFVAFGRQFGTVDGQIITFFVTTVAAGEAAVGLALVIGLFRHRESLNPEAFTALKW